MTDTTNFFSVSRAAYVLLLVALLPLANPALPGNTTLVDFVNVTFIFLFFILFSINKKQLELPLIGPWVVILLGSLVSLFNAQALTLSSLTLVQDAYLFVCFLLLYNLIEERKDVKLFVLLWFIVCVLEGGLAILNVLFRFSVGSSTVSAVEDLSRARATFGNSDTAASYLGISFFLLFQSYLNIRLFWNIIFGMLIFGGIFATKSMSALLGFTTGGLLVFLLYWLHLRGIKKLRLSISALIVIFIIVIFGLPKLMEAENFLDRMPRSAGTRMEIWMAGYESFMRHPLGIGPAAFKIAGNGPFNREGKRAELHNDYISHLVERGPAGFVGLLMFYGALALIIINSLRQAKSDREYLWASGLAGMLWFILVDALNHEGMHYRHVWLAFALIAVQRKLLTDGDNI